KRIVDFDISTGLPYSWSIRLVNLRLYVWPQVFHGKNWLFGVRPSPHIRIDASWGPYIYIESGHTWLLWTGGVPLAVAFVVFTWVALRTTGALARERRGPLGAAATGAFAGVLIVFVLMSFDAHLTMRGVADLLFALLAMVTAVATRLSTGDRHALEPITPPLVPALGDRGATAHA